MYWVVVFFQHRSWVFQWLKKAAEYQRIRGFCRLIPVPMRLPESFLPQSPDFTSVQINVMKS